MPKENQKLEYTVWKIGVLLGIVCVSILLLAYFTPFSIKMLQYDCWIHKKTGLYCPGCGGTRAFLAILHGHILISFFCHPLVPYMGIIYVVYMIRGAIALLSKGKYPFMKYRMGYIYVGIAITLVQFVIKNVALLVFHFAWLA
ncbi:MAG: DUF2752 domain-containing protein [Butyribacter sp.]|nr:DUF2752 domain-containing protein [bacterium]MDY3854744.1 DUF2752 domain-containing protein [Butyribacter sp.]